MSGGVQRPRRATSAQMAAWRDRMGYDKERAAQALGISVRTWYRWLAGTTKSPAALGDKFRTEGWA